MADTTARAIDMNFLGDSMLARREVQRLLVVAGVCFGLATWGLEAILSRIVEGAPHEPLGGVYRLVESMLWIGTASIAIWVAERWPVEDVMRERRRVLAQLALAIALGPVWGMIAYAISPHLMPWWYERGIWGVVAKEAKGALFGYCVTTVLVHVILRARRQRAREVAATAMERAATEAQLVVRKLELQPAVVLRSMDAIARTIPSDTDAANEALVALADNIRRSLTSTRVESVSLRDEIGAIEDLLRLRRLTVGPQLELTIAADASALDAPVPPLLLTGIVDGMLAEHVTTSQGRLSLHAELAERSLRIGIGIGHSALEHRAIDSRDASRRDADWFASAVGRLGALFGDDAEVEHTSTPVGQYVRIALPVDVTTMTTSGSPSIVG